MKISAATFLGAVLVCGQFRAIEADEPPANANSITVPARPEPITIEPSKTAVIVVDMENDFAAKDGMFDWPVSLPRAAWGHNVQATPDRLTNR